MKMQLGRWMVGLLAGFAACNHQARVAFHQTFKADFHEASVVQGISLVVIQTRNGSVDVRCDPLISTVELSGTKFANGPTVEAAREQAERIQIRVGPDPQRPEVLLIAAEFPLGDMFDGGASFRVVLPAAVGVRVRTGNGGVTVVGARGDINIETSNGAAVVTAARGAVEARTSNGRISLQDIGGTVHAHTSNGAIEARSVTGDIEATSSNGPIELVAVTGRQVRARTSNGSLRALGTHGAAVNLESSNGRVEWKATSLPQQPAVKIHNANGAVRVEVPATAAARLRLDTSNAVVSTSFGSAAVRDLKVDRDRVTATLNDGSGRIDVNTSNGGIEFVVGAAVPLTPEAPATTQPAGT